ncbi:MAG: hypothetical protein LJE94_17220 [Deltaproteobacteria bacterium]|nr:hypothetical protein [Deltaproteobacteria bacterium]
MLNRERIIILLMLVVVLYGIYNFFLAPGDNVPARDSSQNLADLKKFVVDAATNLASEHVSAADQYVIQKAENAWPDSPFLQSGAILASQQSEVKVEEAAFETVTLAYTGYIQVEDSLLAIVNGMEYESGEQLGEAGYYVKSISPEKVVIGVANNPQTIILPLDEDVSVRKEAKE